MLLLKKYMWVIKNMQMVVAALNSSLTADVAPRRRERDGCLAVRISKI